MVVEDALIRKVRVLPPMVVVMDVTWLAPEDFVTVMVFPLMPVNVCPSLTAFRSTLTPEMIRLDRVAAALSGVMRPNACRTAMASLVREKTVDVAKGVARKLASF